MFGCLGTPVLDPSSETSVSYADRPRKAPITKGGPNTEGIISTFISVWFSNRLVYLG